ncbi:diguanylate cyclase [Marinobacter sp. CHS3-4]|uniref:GGDEF domain-containing protein n=1 Tax=Marinobacter sp. CHS3-4 TaxID=3045174 RepID=UPI0024B5099B|nr:diguanylate cyclase [Marinobacter sp. CHS3-4]MDI9244097.1 diguanylate cyclase [Marinobacter sp. CHS3-4]
MASSQQPSHQFAIESEEARVSRLLNALSVMAVLFLLGIGGKAWFSEHHVHAWVLWAFGGLVVANMLIFAHTGSRAQQKGGLISIVGLLFGYLIVTGGESNTGPLWFYVFPPLLFYLTDLKTGTAVLLFCAFVAIVVFQFPDLPIVTAEYSSDFKIRFFAALAFESIFCFVLEASRLNARKELMDLAQAHKQAAQTDELTGLSNRRDMQHRLNEEFSRHQRSGHHFSIVLIDLDLFKHINDEYGHDAGDQVLKDFATLMNAVIRKADVASRWGGEEFLILLPDTALLQALTLAERLRQKVAKHEFSFAGDSMPVTISAGVCSIAKTGSVNELLKHADLHLYSAKENGRNRIAPRVRTHEAEADPDTHQPS